MGRNLRAKSAELVLFIAWLYYFDRPQFSKKQPSSNLPGKFASAHEKDFISWLWSGKRLASCTAQDQPVDRSHPISFSSPEPTIILTCGRDRELWLCPTRPTPEVRDSRTSRQIWDFPSNLANLTDWLRIRNEYSAHAQKIGSCQSSRSLPQVRRIVAPGTRMITMEITEFCIFGFTAQCAVCIYGIYGACLKWMLPELSFSDGWSQGTKLWERDWIGSGPFSSPEPRSFWPAAGIESSGWTRFFGHVQSIFRFAGFDGKSVNRGLPVLDKARALDPCRRSEGLWLWGRKWFWPQSIVFTKPFKTGMSLDLARIVWLAGTKRRSAPRN